MNLKNTFIYDFVHKLHKNASSTLELGLFGNLNLGSQAVVIQIWLLNKLSSILFKFRVVIFVCFLHQQLHLLKDQLEDELSGILSKTQRDTHNEKAICHTLKHCCQLQSSQVAKRESGRNQEARDGSKSAAAELPPPHFQFPLLMGEHPVSKSKIKSELLVVRKRRSCGSIILVSEARVVD